ncbi:MAG: RNA polymerase sigma factor [Myxococcota bacterium]|nr:RNA polymerase sigma factor [Myxococcota bacterium]
MAAPELVRGGSTPDEQLIERIEAGDEAAFNVLYDRYFPRVSHFVRRRLPNRADAEETVQEVFINVFSSIGSYRGDAPFAAWVLGVSRRTIAGRFKRKRHSTVPLEAQVENETIDVSVPTIRREPTPLELYECEEQLLRLEERAERRLTDEQRTLFELHHIRHQPIQEIARALDKSEDAVKSNLYRARKLLLAR